MDTAGARARATQRWQSRMAEGRRRRLDRDAADIVRRATALERAARKLAEEGIR